jgi:hypothetical protein
MKNKEGREDGICWVLTVAINKNSLLSFTFYFDVVLYPINFR